MIEINSPVYIRPTHSLRFGGRWGEVVEIDKNNLLPLRVRFNGERILYYFDYDEVLSIEGYFEWLTDKCLVKKTNKVINVKSKNFPLIAGNDGNTYHLKDLLPILHCEKCGVDITGSFDTLCEDCRYPLPED